MNCVTCWVVQHLSGNTVRLSFRYHQHLAAAPQLVPITGKDMKQPVKLGPHALPPVVAIGGADDGIVMEYQLLDAADFFGARAVVVPGLAHDLMLVRT